MSGAPRATDLVVSARGVARFRGRALRCAVGRGGFVQTKAEGDGAAPLGVFALEAALYRPDRLPPPATRLPVAPIRSWSGWSDDPRDPAYNLPVRLPHAYGAERLRRPDPLYDLVVVFDANRHPPEPGAGSALFLHLWRRPRFPTAGCVAFARSDLLWLLSRLERRTRLILR